MADPAGTDAHEYLTVRELARLLRVTERKVYDLAAQGAVPCSRATGKLLFPADRVRDWLESATRGPAPPRPPRPPVFLGSHDPLLDWAIRQSGSELATRFYSSREGLARFAAGDGVATGLHIPEDEGWNIGPARAAAGREDAVLLGWARRRRGLVLRAEDAGAVGGLDDLDGRRLVSRQAGAGSDTLLARLLSKTEARPIPVEPVLSEQDAVLAVREGIADAAFGLEAVARAFGLSFRPVVWETFDILADRRAYFEPGLSRLFEFARSEPFRARAEAFGGYDVTPAGRVRWNA